MNTMKLISLSAVDLTKEEYLQYATDILGVVKKSNVSDFGLTGVYNLAEAGLAEASNYSKEERRHPLSADIDADRLLRDQKITAVIALAKGYKQAPAATIKSAVELAVPELEVHLAGFTRANNFVKSQRLKMLFAKMDADTELTNALQVIGLKSYLDETKAVEANMKTLVENRRATKPEKNGTLAVTIFANSASMLRKLLTTIETNATVETDKDFKPLISELNAVIAEFKLLLKIRKAHRKTPSATNATAPAAATTGTVQNEVAQHF